MRRLIVDFPRVDSFLSSFHDQNFDIDLVMLVEILNLSGQELIDPFKDIFIKILRR